MVRVIFTLDYEIHGNGEGSPYQLMVEPTHRLLRLFDRYGAKLTIMADIGEILKFQQYAREHRKDDCHYHDIVAQLQSAVERGHDVQLHVHPSYFNARHDGSRWVQDWSEYDLAGLDADRLDQVVKLGKDFLESTLRPVKPDYACTAFRAANWSVNPSRNVVRALLRNGIQIDTSVFKYGRREGMVNFDYTLAKSEMVPWRADENALWREDPRGRIWEVPIYSEQKHITGFFSLNRIYRATLGRFHRVPDSLGGEVSDGGANGRRGAGLGRLRKLFGKHAWKADFNQCTGGQLIRALKRGAARHQSADSTVPFVLIGHSKLFTLWNERTLRPFLGYVAGNTRDYAFGTLDELNLSAPALQLKEPVE